MNEHHSNVNPGFLTTHTLQLSGLNQQNTILIVRELEELPYMDSVTLNEAKQTIKLAYDASHHDIDEMIAIIKKYGAALFNSWWSRTKLGWQRQIDQNIKDNANLEAHCCNKMPPRK
ncbi:hypothetical protein PY479_10350 [Shewanella sp. A32]|uniref:hypothetical protein n=1 Tax=Shewanella sp. A32 TaxID=3031327 RepID=UPI0023B88DFE|nr:hypothetical protein [Shewanella sp. A32]MDF0534671.1 hypothetical protein [Shewanella sp. A32]